MSKTKATTGTTKSVKAESTSAPSPFSRLLPYGVAILSFIVITFIFFSPMITDSKVIQQGDIVQFEGMAHEVKTSVKRTTLSRFGRTLCLAGCRRFRFQRNTKEI
jgi:hypothetical protein